MFLNTPGTTGWTRVQVPISPLGSKLGLSYREKIVEYDFDDYRPRHVYLRLKTASKLFENR